MKDLSYLENSLQLQYVDKLSHPNLYLEHFGLASLSGARGWAGNKIQGRTKQYYL